VGTVAVTFVSEFTVNVAEIPLNFTPVALLKLVPLIVTEVPTGPLVGLKLVMAGVTVNKHLQFLVTLGHTGSGYRNLYPHCYHGGPKCSDFAAGTSSPFAFLCHLASAVRRHRFLGR
jgi:hypothetical protein